MSVVQDGDYTITCEETLYEPKDEMTNILYATNGTYKMHIFTSQWNVYKGATSAYSKKAGKSKTQAR